MRYSISVLVPALLGCASHAPEPQPLYFVTASLESPSAGTPLDANDPSGFLLGSPAGFTVGNAPGDMSPADPAIRLKSAGFDDIWVGHPRVQSFRDFVGTWFPPPPDGESPLLAMSLGIDVFRIEEKALDPTQDVLDGVLATGQTYAIFEIGGHGWAALQFTVDSAAIDEDPTQAASLAPDVLEAYRQRELDRTVFSFLHPGSAAVTVPGEETSVRAMDPDALGLGTGDAIHALNMHMALYGVNPADFVGFTAAAKLPERPTVFFTLRPRYLTAAVKTALESEWNLAADPDSQTIYQSTWDASGWSRPNVFRTAAQLGLTQTKPPVVIDGLAMAVSGATKQVVFSLASDPVAEQIRFVDLANSPATPRRVIIRESKGTYRSLGSRLHAGRGIGDFCIKDPDGDARVRGLLVFDDFAVARRLAPVLDCGGGAPAAATLRRPIRHVELRLTPIVDPRAPLPLAPAPAPGDTSEHGRPVARPPALPVTTVRVPIDLSELHLQDTSQPEVQLAVAGYRQWSDQTGRSYMRTCMSWPRPTSSTGTVQLCWGFMDRHLDPAGATIAWDPPIPMVYVGEPLVADHWIPPVDEPHKGRSLVAQWTLTTESGVTLVAPLCVLRY